jgi:hypothetical protein
MLAMKGLLGDVLELALTFLVWGIILAAIAGLGLLLLLAMAGAL